jgi:arylsulfatase A-like enzyme
MNVLMISVDDCRMDRIGCMSTKANSESLTPTIDNLGYNALRCLNNFTVANGSVPSHTSIFTGCYPQTHGIRHNGLRIPDDIVTIAEIVQKKNIETVGVVSTVLLDSMYNLNKGFDTYFNTAKNARLLSTIHKIGYKKYNLSNVLRLFGFDPRKRTWKEVNKDAKNWLNKKNINDSTPFFMFLHYFDIHGDTAGGATRIKGKLKSYDKNVKLIDNAVKEIIDVLKEKKMFDNTILVIFSDHGEGFGDEEKMIGHGYDVDDEEFNTPLIIYHKDLPPTAIKKLTRTIDIAPTILHLLQIEHPFTGDGQNLIPLTNGGTGPQEAFLEAYPPFGDVKAVVTNEWKFVLKDGKDEALYKRQETKTIKINVAAQNQETARQLKRKLKQHFKIPFEEKELDDITKERLQGLGYLD